jgi:glucose/arabinose dehydrogenase
MKAIEVWIKIGLVALFMSVNQVYGQEEEGPATASIEGHVFKPALRQATAERVQQLQVPPGFKVEKFAEGLGEARMMAISEAGAVFVTDRSGGRVIRLQDTNGDGRADEKTTVAEIEKVHGINIYGGRIYMANVKEIYAAELEPEGRLGEPRIVVDDLPDGGQHPNRTFAFGPDNRMYVSIGSTCNACEESNEEHATLLRMNPNGGDREVFARGLRNTTGFGWHPKTSEMWGMDHGIDWLGDEEQKEELNRLVEGGNYGWPYIYSFGKKTPHRDPEEMSAEEYAAQAIEPVLEEPDAHSAALGMVFYRGEQFPEEYRHDAFVALHGSWNRSKPVGYKVSRIRYNDQGQPEGFEDFLTGFLVEDNRAQFGRPVGLAVHPDGSLFVTDDENGVVYRIFYQP